jgi:hypothetical protein
MARDTRGLKPENMTGRPLRSGRESMKAPGDGEITKAVVSADRRYTEQSAALHADGLDALRGFSTCRPHKYEDSP